MLPSSVSRDGVCRLIVDPPAEGAWNMAVDEALVEAVAEDQTPTMRIYRWARPTLSLGYFQQYAERLSHPPSREALVVRRLSGGGAILHDQEITYSLVVPSTHRLAADTQLLYNTMHQAIVKWLADYLVEESFDDESAHLSLTLCAGEAQREPPFLCFQRRSPGDVLLVDVAGTADHKIVGSAQRRRRGGVLQHGSVLWSTSPAAPELCGFTQLASLNVPLGRAVRDFVSNVPSSLGLAWEETSLSPALIAEAEKKCEIRYKSLSWNKRR